LNYAKSLGLNRDTTDEAVAAVKKVLDLDPNNAQALVTWGNILLGPASQYYDEEKFMMLSTEAVAKYQLASEIDPGAFKWIAPKMAASNGNRHLLVALRLIQLFPGYAAKLGRALVSKGWKNRFLISEPTPELSDAMLIQFANGGPHSLAIIQIERCSSVSDAGIDAIVQSCKVRFFFPGFGFFFFFCFCFRVDDDPLLATKDACVNSVCGLFGS
jgi:tetratricopeptide (TPR) repeat protein